MSEAKNGDAPRRKMTRCPEGHIFDAGAHASCPTCKDSASVARADDDANGKTATDDDIRKDLAPPPAPQPAWLKPALIGGAAALAALVLFLALRGSPEKIQIATNSSVSETASRDTAPAGPQRWKTVMKIGGREYVCENETQPDGRYRLGNGCPFPFAGETGTTTVDPDGTYISRSDAGRIDRGRIEAVSEDKFIAHTLGGPVVWERVKP